MQIARLCTLVLASVIGCYQPEFAGLVCRDDRECGPLACVDGVCGGDEPATTSGPPDTSTDAATSSSSEEPPGDDSTTESTDTPASADASNTDITTSEPLTTGDPETTTDDNSDTTTGAEDDTIYEIQRGKFDPWDVVVVRNVVVTAIASTGSGFFVQEHTGGPYSGVWVYVGIPDPNANPNLDIAELAVGDEVNITGTVHEYHDLTEFDAREGSITRTGVISVHPAPTLLPIATFTTYGTAEPWEGVLIAIQGAPLTVSALLPAQEFEVTGDAAMVVDDLAHDIWQHPGDFPQFGLGASFTGVVGPLNAYNNTFKILPRSPVDFTGYTPPALDALGVEDLQPGDLVITEIMYNPTADEDESEWIEVFNNTAMPIELYGLAIQDSLQDPDHQGNIVTSTIVAPGAFAILGYKGLGTWPYPDKPDAFYGDYPPLNNGIVGDTVYLKNSTLTIDVAAPYVGSSGDQGLSWKLDPQMFDAVANDDPAHWCYSSAIFYMSERGSPRKANEVPCSDL